MPSNSSLWYIPYRRIPHPTLPSCESTTCFMALGSRAKCLNWWTQHLHHCWIPRKFWIRSVLTSRSPRWDTFRHSPTQGNSAFPWSIHANRQTKVGSPQYRILHAKGALARVFTKAPMLETRGSERTSASRQSSATFPTRLIKAVRRGMGSVSRLFWIQNSIHPSTSLVRVDSSQDFVQALQDGPSTHRGRNLAAPVQTCYRRGGSPFIRLSVAALYHP
jgi:hypothetical protein